MTTDFVIAYVRRKMKEEGHGDKYVLGFRELKLRAKEQVVIAATGQYYYPVTGKSASTICIITAGLNRQLAGTRMLQGRTPLSG